MERGPSGGQPKFTKGWALDTQNMGKAKKRKKRKEEVNPRGHARPPHAPAGGVKSETTVHGKNDKGRQNVPNHSWGPMTRDSRRGVRGSSCFFPSHHEQGPVDYR